MAKDTHRPRPRKKLRLLNYFTESRSYSLETRMYVNIQLGVALLCFTTFIIDGFLNHYPKARLLWVAGVVITLVFSEVALRGKHVKTASIAAPIVYTLLVFFGVHVSGSILSPSVLFSFLTIIVVIILADGILEYICVGSIIAFVAFSAIKELGNENLDQAMRHLYIDWVVYFTVIAIVVMWLIGRIVDVLRDYDRAIKDANAELYSISITDPLTEVFNKRHFQDFADEFIRNQRSRTTTAAFLMVDIDYFKQYNDYYGHPQGDVCLQKVAKVLRDSLYRKADLVFRVGGEEFLMVLPEIQEEAVWQIAERVHEKLAEEKIEHKASTISPYVTVSIGTVKFDMNKHKNMEEILQIVDDALYTAKESGRNRTVNVSAM